MPLCLFVADSGRLLLNVDGTPIVSTAAHVIDHLRESPLYVGGSKGGGAGADNRRQDSVHI
jgi:hypothetical protein